MDSNSVLILAFVFVAVLALIALSTRRPRTAAPPDTPAVLPRLGAARAGTKLAIKPLPEPQRQRFAEAWRQTQAEFVDSPEAAVTDAARLVRELMQAAGYPMGSFGERAADLAADHPRVVESYRAAIAIAEVNERGAASTDDLREAMMHYRSLFGELLADRAVPAVPARRAVRQVALPAGARQ